MQACGQAADVKNCTHIVRAYYLVSDSLVVLWDVYIFRRNAVQFSFSLFLHFCLYLFPSQYIAFGISRIYTRKCINWKGRMIKAVDSGKIMAVTSAMFWAVRMYSVCFL